jgi:hypothetical protein
VPLESLRKLSNNMRTLYDARVVEEKVNNNNKNKKTATGGYKRPQSFLNAVVF